MSKHNGNNVEFYFLTESTDVNFADDVLSTRLIK